MKRRESLVAFEQKQATKDEPTSVFWIILRWYWLIVPSIYFLFIVPGALEDGGVLAPGAVFNLLFQLLNYGFAGIMTVTSPLERSKTGIADTYLKIAVAQQFLAQNILGTILSVVVWYQLPYKVNPEKVEPEEMEKWHFQPKTLKILSFVILGITILAVVGQIMLVI